MNYTLTIDNFEGPLDLLLHLIKESKMDIFNLKIEEITKQYLDYIHKMEEMNLDIASSYLVMSAELLEIKSKMLLPKHEEDIDEEEDPRSDLVNRLIEYKKYKEITKDFKNLESERKQIITKMPENIKEYGDNISNNGDITLNDLIEAFQKFLDREKENQPIQTKVTSKELSVEKRRTSIRNILFKKKRVNFIELFETINKEYVIVTFLAILEMAKDNEIKLYQDKNFDNIICEVN